VGKVLKRRSFIKSENSVVYSARSKDCGVCELKYRCTINTTGRTVKRHIRKQEVDYMKARAKSVESRRDIRIRQHLMERTFARGL